MADVMKTSCLINNYNYGRFVVEAVESALTQTHPFDEVIVVDDGSTDDSRARLEPFVTDQKITLISKPNEGQLSCFNVGFAASTGDIVCFLDADDAYDPNYLESTLAVYEKNADCDSVYTELREYNQPPPADPMGEDHDLGYSVILTLCMKTWIGAPTSCLSIRRRLLEKILPIPYTEEWRTRADDCLVFGASIMGGRKYHLSQPLVRYRVHGANNYIKGKRDRFGNYRRRLAINRLFDLLTKRSGLDPDSLPELAHREFQTLVTPTWKQWYQYSRIPFRSRVRWSRRFALIASMAGYFFLGLQK